MLIGVVGLAMVVLVPLVWGVMRRTTGLPMFGVAHPRRGRGPVVPTRRLAGTAPNHRSHPIDQLPGSP